MWTKEEQIAAYQALRRKKSAKSIIYFAQEYLSHLTKYKTPDFHKEIYSLLEADEKRIAIAAPRSFAKSTIVQIIRGLHLLLTGNGEDIITMSSSGSLAEEWIRRIKIELETNEKIISDFLPVMKWGKEVSMKWTESHLTIDNHDGSIKNQIRAKGRGYQIRGFRPTRIFLDDLEDDELVKSAEQRDKLRDWFKKALLNTVNMEQQIVYIGTILHPLSLLSEVIEKKTEEFEKWTTKKYKALDSNGKSIWEEKWSTADLLRKKMEIGTYAFQAEFMNEPLSGENQLIRFEWVQKYDKLPEGKNIKFMIIDPAISTQESADKTAMSILAFYPDLMQIYEVDSIAGRWGVWEIYENLKTFYKRYNPVEIGIEAIAYQQVLKPIFLKESRNEHLFLPIKSITLGTYKSKDSNRRESKDKFTRALGVTHLFEQLRVFLRNKELIEQVITFPTGDHDDLFDCLIYGLHRIMKYTKEAKIIFDETERISPLKSISVKSFEVKERDRIPCLAPPPSAYMGKQKHDWRT